MVTAPPAGSGWEALSAALTDEAPVLAERDDLTVAIVPGAGQGSPACLLPALARIEIDGTHLGVDPATAHPARPADRYRYPTAWGLFVHECAHARHTAWTPTPDAPPAAVRAAMLLEESRIEAAHTRRRPDDRHWLRAATTELILADLTPPTARPPPTAPADGEDGPGHRGTDTARDRVTPPSAPTATGHAATPAVGQHTARRRPTAPDDRRRRPARPPTRPRPCRAVSWRRRGPRPWSSPAPTPASSTPSRSNRSPPPPNASSARDRVAGLREIWQAAHTVADTDAEAMLELGRRWCTTVGIDPDAAPHPSSSSSPTGAGGLAGGGARCASPAPASRS